MDDHFVSTPPPTRTGQRSLRPILLAALAAFLVGSVMTFYFSRAIDWASTSPEPAVSGDPVPDEPSDLSAPAEPRAIIPEVLPSVRTAAEAVQRMAEVEEQQGGIDQRVAAMEQRLARLDLQAQAAAGNAARAEGLLIAYAARRAIERGAPLGYLADQLRLRFGDALPNAVDAVIAAGNDPVTIDQLQARLDGMAPVLSQAPVGEGVLPRIGRELSQLFVIRTDDTPAPRPQSRLQRARMFLETGRVEAAINEVSNMPNPARAAAWITDAERYARAQRGLELLETTAILEPRRLRDGSGNLVEQPSPAA